MELETLPTGFETVTTAQINTTKLAQKDAVYQYITEALVVNNYGLDVIKNSESVEGKTLRKTVRTRLFEGFKSGTIELKVEKTDSQLKKYCSGLITDRLKRDKRFK